MPVIGNVRFSWRLEAGGEQESEMACLAADFASRWRATRGLKQREIERYDDGSQESFGRPGCVHIYQIMSHSALELGQYHVVKVWNSCFHQTVPAFALDSLYWLESVTGLQ